MILSSEQLFQSVFNYATLPMLVVNADDSELIIIAHNKQHKIISNTLDRDVTGAKISEVFESLSDAKDLALFIDNLALSKAKKEVIQLPFFKFTSIENTADIPGQRAWRIEIIPVLNLVNDVEYLLSIWHSIDNDNHIEILPVTKTQLGEELVAANEQIETGNEQLEVATEEIEAINDELAQTQEKLNKLSQQLEEKVNQHADGNSDKKPEIETQKDRLKRFLMQAPAGICVLDGPEFIFELINPSFQELFPGRNLIGKTFVTALPEIKGQLMWDILQEVYATGETFQGSEMLIPLAKEETEMLKNVISILYIRLGSIQKEL
ncbi:PAS domain-containing protein [Pedobacter sp. NJ-S-72]